MEGNLIVFVMRRFFVEANHMARLTDGSFPWPVSSLDSTRRESID